MKRPHNLKKIFLASAFFEIKVANSLGDLMFYRNYFLSLINVNVLSFGFSNYLHPVAVLQSKSDKSFLCAMQEKFALLTALFKSHFLLLNAMSWEHKYVIN